MRRWGGLGLAALILAAGAVLAALGLVRLAEARAEARLARQLSAAGAAWASVEADGFRLEVRGEAPDGDAQAAVLALAAVIAGPGNVENRTRIAPPPPEPAAEPRLELLREGTVVALAGLLPGDRSRDRIRAALAGLGPALRIDDRTLTGAAAGETANWTAALDLGLAAVAALPRAQIGIGPCRIAVTGVAADVAGRAAVLDALRAAGPCLERAEILLPAAPAAPAAAAPPDPGPAAPAGIVPPATADLPGDFTASRRADGSVLLSGAVLNPTARQAIAAYAGALFGSAAVTDATRIDGRLPEGWTARIMAGLEAMAPLAEGTLRVGETEVSLAGRTLAPDGALRAEAALAAAIGPDALVTVAVTYDAPAAAAATPVTAEPEPETCLAAAAAALEAAQIVFASGAAAIDPASAPTLDALATALKPCPSARFEFGGHTDDSGPADGNLVLSRKRAESVVGALADRGVPLAALVAAGYGETEPVADNGTEDGKARNRRISVRLLEAGDDRK